MELLFTKDVLIIDFSVQFNFHSAAAVLAEEEVSWMFSETLNVCVISDITLWIISIQN